MKEEGKVITCINAENMRSLINQAKELKIKKEDIVQFFQLKNSIYLIYYN